MEMILDIEIGKTIFVLLFFVLPVSLVYMWLYINDSSYRKLEKKQRQERKNRMEMLMNNKEI